MLSIIACCMFIPIQVEASSVETEVFADCFEYAITELLSLEADLGFQLGGSSATSELNTNFAVCECLENGNCFI